MIKFDAILDYDDDSGDPTHYTIVWDGKDIAEISKHKRTYQVLSRQTLSAAYFDTELEALEYVIELIRVLENE